MLWMECVLASGFTVSSGELNTSDGRLADRTVHCTADAVAMCEPLPRAAIVMEELQQVPGTSLEQGLDQLGSEIRNNLTPQHYFTEVRIGDKPQTFGEVTEYTALERDGRLTFMFILPLTSPQPLSGQVLEYQVFDPTYYIEMVHEEEGDEPSPQALILNGEPDCTLSVLPADPDPEKVLQASLLDVDEEGEPGLGRHFAETGRVDCR